MRACVCLVGNCDSKRCVSSVCSVMRVSVRVAVGVAQPSRMSGAGYERSERSECSLAVRLSEPQRK